MLRIISQNLKNASTRKLKALKNRAMGLNVEEVFSQLAKMMYAAEPRTGMYE